MKIQLTDNALLCLEFHPDFQIPLSAKECFGGNQTTDICHATPDLTEGIRNIWDTIYTIKKELNKKIRTLTPEVVSIFPSELSYQFIIDNIHITLITKEDDKGNKHIPVRNLFKYIANQTNEYSYQSITVKGTNDKNLLGLYQPLTGCVFIWIDKIFEYDFPELIFQKVLLHEIIHAFLDIQPRIYYQYNHGTRILYSLGEQADCKREETYDNALVLRAYSHHPKEFDTIKEFIAGQPKEYSESINVFNNQGFPELLKKHLNDKISDKEIQNQTDMFFEILSCDEDKEEFNPKEFSDENFEKYIDSFTCLIPHYFSDIELSFKESIGKDKYHRFLIGSSFYECNYYSPWLVVMYNDSTKEVLLQVGKRYFIRYDFNHIIECLKNEPNRDFEIFSEYDTFDSEAGEIVQSLILDAILPFHFLHNKFK